MSIIFQSILGGIAIFFLVQNIRKFIGGDTSYALGKFFATFIIWAGVLFFALFPNLARVISLTLHIGENLNTLIFIGFVIVFLFLFRLLRAIEKLEKDITKLVRNNTLDTCKDEK